MKPAVFLKWADVLAQLAAVAGPIAYLRFCDHSFSLLSLYFSVGATQLASALLNLCFLPKPYRFYLRTAYEIIVASALFLTLLVWLISGAMHTPVYNGDDGLSLVVKTLGIFYIFLSPILAFIYFTGSVLELIAVRGGKPVAADTDAITNDDDQINPEQQ